jgi:polyphosphate kinase
VLIEELIAANVCELFPNMKTSEAFLFRVTRDADLELREDEAGDLLRSLERELQRRRDRFAVRLEVESTMPEKMVRLLTTGIGLASVDVERVNGFVNIPDLMQLYGLDMPALKDRPITPVVPAALQKAYNIFDIVKKQDVLLHHPYSTFNTVTDFLAQAADDANVQAIKICLYRTGRDSPIVHSLTEAVNQGKQVTALIELKARFDEENNIEWARRLENEGVHVVYGITNLKVHSNGCLVVRREKDKLVRYVHLATGNYNPLTARVYTDLGLLTANGEIGEDASSLFNFLTGYSQQETYNRLLVAPVDMREKLIGLVRREKKNKLGGKDARIIIKVNALTDVEMIDELYKASQSGVPIDLIVRGICSLRPGVKGLSENIRVRSIVGRFLEHSRIFYFCNGGGEEEELYIGSSDIMNRSFDRRVEVIVPILEPRIRGYIKDTILDAFLRDEVNACILKPDGTYKKLAGRKDSGFNSQMFFVGRHLPV